MTDPTQALAELRPSMAILQKWREEDHEDYITLHRDDVIALIEESRDLIPRADHDLAVARALMHALNAVTEADHACEGAHGSRERIRAMATADALAELRALRAENAALLDRVKGLVEALEAEHAYWDAKATADLRLQDAGEVAMDYPMPRRMTYAMRKADDLSAALKKWE